MLPAKRDRAKRAVSLRKEGASIKSIARKVGCSPSTASRWVKDVVLSEEQKKSLEENARGWQKSASLVMQENARQKRLAWREEGRVRARHGDWRHAMGCALYWAEGGKSRNGVCLANTDPVLIKAFHGFLVNEFPDEKVHVQFSYHGDEGNASEPDSRMFWSKYLGVPASEIKSFMNKDKRARAGMKKKRHEHGMCILLVHRTRVVQHIYGALEEYMGVDIF